MALGNKKDAEIDSIFAQLHFKNLLRQKSLTVSCLIKWPILLTLSLFFIASPVYPQNATTYPLADPISVVHTELPSDASGVMPPSDIPSDPVNGDLTSSPSADDAESGGVDSALMGPIQSKGCNGIQEPNLSKCMAAEKAIYNYNQKTQKACREGYDSAHGKDDPKNTVTGTSVGVNSIVGLGGACDEKNSSIFNGATQIGDGLAMASMQDACSAFAKFMRAVESATTAFRAQCAIVKGICESSCNSATADLKIIRAYPPAAGDIGVKEKGVIAALKTCGSYSQVLSGAAIGLITTAASMMGGKQCSKDSAGLSGYPDICKQNPNLCGGANGANAAVDCKKPEFASLPQNQALCACAKDPNSAACLGGAGPNQAGLNTNGGGATTEAKFDSGTMGIGSGDGSVSGDPSLVGNPGAGSTANTPGSSGGGGSLGGGGGGTGGNPAPPPGSSNAGDLAKGGVITGGGGNGTGVGLNIRGANGEKVMGNSRNPAGLPGNLQKLRVGMDGVTAGIGQTLFDKVRARYDANRSRLLPE